jgi:UMP-CMP kinase
MLERLMERSKTSGREDDNRESIVKRFRGFIVSLDPRFDSLPLSLSVFVSSASSPRSCPSF